MASNNSITKAQEAQIRSLMKDDRWDAVVRYVALKLERWQDERISGANEFETLRALFTRDGKVEGVREVFDGMEQQAFE